MDTRIQAAERILDRGVRFWWLPAPLLYRLFKLNKVDIRPLMAGTILEISIVVVENNLEEALKKEDWGLLEKSIEPIARCVAIAVLRTREKIENKADELTKKLLWRFQAGTLIGIFRIIEEQNRIMDFTSITRFFCRQTMMMMNPKNLGQEESGR